MTQTARTDWPIEKWGGAGMDSECGMQTIIYRMDKQGPTV